jgi:hypothetical protein
MPRRCKQNKNRLSGLSQFPHGKNRPLDLLLEKGLIEASQGDRLIYRTTPEGERAIVTLQEARAIYS